MHDNPYRAEGKRKRRWFQIRLSTWFVLVAILAFLIATVGGDERVSLVIWPILILLAFVAWKALSVVSNLVLVARRDDDEQDVLTRDD